MTAKEYLSQIRLLNIKISQKQKEMASLHIMAAGVGSSATDAVRVVSSPRQDAMENRVLKILKLTDEIDADITRYAIIRDNIINQIHGLGRDVYIEILYKKYVENFKLEEVAKSCDYSYVQIKRLHVEALNAFEDKYSNMIPNDTLLCDIMIE